MDIQTLIGTIAGLITGCGTISLAVKKWLINPVNEKIDNLELSIAKIDLVNFITDIEHGVPKSQIQKMNAHELYDRYTEKGGNSYVHEHWEKLVKEGKL